MAKGQRPRDEKHWLRPTPVWRGLLAQHWRLLEKQRGKKQEVLAEAGVPKQTAARATNEKSEEPVSHDVFERIRVALNAATGTPIVPEPIPPPFVPVEDPDDYLWIQAGRVLRSSDPARFGVLLAEVQRFAAHVEAQRESAQRLRETMDPASTKSRSSARPQRPHHEGD